MRQIAMTGLLVAALSIDADLCYGQEYTDAVVHLPPSLKAIRLGMTGPEVLKLVPGAKLVFPIDQPRGGFAVFFTGSDEWEGAMLDFIDGRLAAINLLAGLEATSGALQKTERLLADLTAKNGPGFARMIALNTPKRPVPVQVWTKGEVVVFAAGPSLGVSVTGKEIIPVDSSLRVGITAVTRPLPDLIPLATATELTDLLFKALSPMDRK